MEGTIRTVLATLTESKDWHEIVVLFKPKKMEERITTLFFLFWTDVIFNRNDELIGQEHISIKDSSKCYLKFARLLGVNTDWIYDYHIK